MARFVSIPKVLTALALACCLAITASAQAYELKTNYSDVDLQRFAQMAPEQACIYSGELKHILLETQYRATEVVRVSSRSVTTLPVEADDSIIALLPRSPIKLVGSGTMGKYSLAAVHYAPIYYDESQGKLVVTSHVVFDLNTEYAPELRPWIESPVYDDFISSRCLGSENHLEGYRHLEKPKLQLC